MTSRPRCVFDSNVLISAGLTPRGTSRRVLEWALTHGRVLTSRATWYEFTSRFLTRPKFDRYATPQERSAFVATLGAKVETVAVTSQISVCADPDDDRFVEVAIDGRADVIVTGNTRDFPAGYRGIPVITPGQFGEAYVPSPLS